MLRLVAFAGFIFFAIVVIKIAILAWNKEEKKEKEEELQDKLEDFEHESKMAIDTFAVDVEDVKANRNRIKKINDL